MIKMHSIKYFLLTECVMIILIVMSAGGSRGQPDPGTTNAPSDIPWLISTDKDVYYPGEPIYLTQIIKNKDKITISYQDVPPLDMNRMHLAFTKDASLSHSSTSVPLTVYGDDFAQREGNIGFGSTVAPNDQIETCFLLNQVRDITLPGHYRLYLTDTKGILHSDDKYLDFVSNTIDFTIKPTEREARDSIIKMIGNVPHLPQSDQAVSGVVLTVSTDKTICDPDDPIICTVAIKNYSQSTLDMVAKDPIDSPLLNVVLLQGRRISDSDVVMPVTAYGNLELQQNAPIQTGPYLLPGQEYVRTFLLNRVRDMTMAGDYTIQLNETLNIKGVNHGMHLISNVATVKINWQARLIPGHPRELGSEIPAEPSQSSKGN